MIVQLVGPLFIHVQHLTKSSVNTRQESLYVKKNSFIQPLVAFEIFHRNFQHP